MGKKVDEWDRARKSLIKAYSDVGIEYCELNIDGKHNGLWVAFAHGRKRRHLVGTELYTFVAKACQGCHDYIEYEVGKDEMARIIQEAIDARAIQPVIVVGGVKL